MKQSDPNNPTVHEEWAMCDAFRTEDQLLSLNSRTCFGSLLFSPVLSLTGWHKNSHWRPSLLNWCLKIRVSHFYTFFLIELSPFNHSCSWVVGVHKKNFSVIDQKLKCGERFSCLHFLEGKNAQNRPENQQNWNMAKIAPKIDKFTKSKP